MEILVKKNFGGSYEKMDILEGLTYEGLVMLCRSEEDSTETAEKEYPIILVRENGIVRRLTAQVKADAKIELMDMRYQEANIAYQNSIILLYLSAIKKLFGEDADAVVENSLNGGVYTKVFFPHGEKAEQLDLVKALDPDKRGDMFLVLMKAVEATMRRMVKDDIPIESKIITREEAITALEGFEEKCDILRTISNDVKLYTLEGYSSCFCTELVPSTGYLQDFALRRYKNGIILQFPNQQNPDGLSKYKKQPELYKVFSEVMEWEIIAGGIFYAPDLNRCIKDGNARQLILISEALHEKRIAQIADMISRRKRRVVLITGPSSSGKTTFAKKLCTQLAVNGARPLYLSTDDYFVEREDTPLDAKGEPDFENLGAVDVKLFNSQLNELLAGEEVDLPTFDFIKGTKIFGTRKVRLTPDQPIVIEGIHALNDDLTPEVSSMEKFKVYISPFTQLNIDRHNRIPTTDARLVRRMVRDSQYRGRSAEDTILGWPKVRAAEDVNIFPYNDEADVFFNSAHLYETAVLKKWAVPLLEQVPQDSEAYSEAQRLLRFFRYLEPIEDDGILPNTSILKEFIGGSVYK